MKIHHLRNATFVIELDRHHILVDPMLSARGTLPPYARLRHRSRRNPIVDLPANADPLLKKVTHCLLTHNQKLGLRLLQHTDHLDWAGESFLRGGQIPVLTSRLDALYLKEHGLNVVASLRPWQPERFLDGTIMAVPARHGHGWIHRLMANGAGFFLDFPDEPSIYISGDTIYSDDVKRALNEYQPDVAIMAAGGASLDVGGPILMPLEEQLGFVRQAPGRIVANHLEALNHCPITRSQLKAELAGQGLTSKVIIPEDGETVDL